MLLKEFALHQKLTTSPNPSALNFWLAFKQIFGIWPSNLSLLSIILSLSQILSSPIFAELCLNLVFLISILETIKWHLSVSSSMELFTNKKITSSEFLSNLSRTLSSGLSQTKGVASKILMMKFTSRILLIFSAVDFHLLPLITIYESIRGIFRTLSNHVVRVLNTPLNMNVIEGTEAVLQRYS